MSKPKGGFSLPDDPALKLQEMIIKEGQGSAVGNTLARTHADTQASESESVSATTRESETARDIESMGAGTPVTLNTRIPPAYKEWLELQAFRGKKQGITIQSQVTDALREYIEKRTQEEG